MVIRVRTHYHSLDNKLTVFQGGDANLANFSIEGFLKTLQEEEVFGTCRQDIASSCNTGISANQLTYAHSEKGA